MGLRSMDLDEVDGPEFGDVDPMLVKTCSVKSICFGANCPKRLLVTTKTVLVEVRGKDTMYLSINCSCHFQVGPPTGFSID